MRFIHIADTHLGAMPDVGKAYSAVRPKELWDSLAEIIDICEEQKIELLLIAGDMFHRQPLLRELKELNYLFSKLTITKVVFMAGNHDYIRPDSYYREFQWCDNVYPLLGKTMEWINLPELEVGICGLSYYKREILEACYDDMVHTVKKQKYEILLAHGGDGKHIPINKHKMSSNCFDYYALGHIHKAQVLIENRMHYAGALEPIDKNDIGKHGYVLGEMSKAGCRTKFIESAKREYILLEIVINKSDTSTAVKEKIQELILNNGKQNIYKVVLNGFRDPDIIFAIESMDVYGNIIDIVDETKPSYDFEMLLKKNADNLLGQYIKSFKDSDIGSVEYIALYKGVEAIIETKRG